MLVESDSHPPSVAGLPVLGRIGALSVLAEAFEADTVIIATSGVDPATTTRLMRQLADAGVHVELSFAVRDVAHDRLIVTERGRLAVAYVVPPIRGRWRTVAKRTFDIVVAGGAIILTAPLLLFIAIAIKVDSSGPVSFANAASAVTVSSSRS